MAPDPQRGELAEFRPRPSARPGCHRKLFTTEAFSSLGKAGAARNRQSARQGPSEPRQKARLSSIQTFNGGTAPLDRKGSMATNQLVSPIRACRYLQSGAIARLEEGDLAKRSACSGVATKRIASPTDPMQTLSLYLGRTANSGRHS